MMKSLKKKFLEQYTQNLLLACYDVAHVKQNLGIDEDTFYQRVLNHLKGDKE